MKRVIKVSKAWIAAFTVGMLLAGCGGGGSDEAGTSASGSTSSGNSVVASEGTKAAANTAVLSWSAPSTRVNGDGIAMGELDKYVIRYGQSADDLSLEVVVDNAESYADMSYTVENLAAGTWYFTIQVQDTQGLISEPSEPVSKTIQS